MSDQPFDYQSLVPTVASQPAGGRFRQGTVQAVASNYTISVTVAGSSTVLTGVKYLGSLHPVVGDQVWLVTDGLDMFALGMVAQAATTYAARVTRATDLPIASGTETTVGWSSVSNDPGTSWTGGTSAAALYALLTGTYMATATVAFAGNATGYRRVTILQEITDTVLGRASVPTIGAGAPTYVNVATPSFTLQAGQAIYMTALQNSGGGLDIVSTAGTPNMTLIYLGP